MKKTNKKFMLDIDLDNLFLTTNGILYHGNCFNLFSKIKSNSIDTVFADPPFNLQKEYGPNINDNLSDKDYLKWCYQWIRESVRVLKP